MKLLPCWLLCMWLGVSLGVSSLAWADDAGELARIASQRQVLHERFAEEERACRSRFVVTACLDDVRARQREALAPLRERELRLADEGRQQRAAQRRGDIAAKQQAAQARPAVPPASASRPRQPTPGAPQPPPRPAPHPEDSAARDAQAQARVHAAERRREQAKAAQARVARRLAEQQVRGKAAQALPPPTAASSPAR